MDPILYLYLLFALTATLVIVRGVLVQINSQTSVSEKASVNPAELAFLAHNGNMLQTRAIMSVDALHRQLQSEPQLFNDMTTAGTISFSRPKESNPIIEAIHASPNYKHLSSTVKSYLSKVLKDDRGIKAHFQSVPTQSTKPGLEQQLSDSLENKGLLLPEQNRQRLSLSLFVLAAVGLIALILIVTQSPTTKAFLLLLLSALSAIGLRHAFSFSQLIPLYGRISHLLKHPGNGDRIVGYLRFLAGLGPVLAFLLTMATVLIILLLDLLALQYIAHCITGFDLFCLLFATSCFYVIFSSLREGWSLKLIPSLSNRGREFLKAERKRLSNSNLVPAFNDVLQSEKYSPKFSELLAIYGYETLWFLT